MPVVPTAHRPPLPLGLLTSGGAVTNREGDFPAVLLPTAISSNPVGALPGDMDPLAAELPETNPLKLHLPLLFVNSPVSPNAHRSFPPGSSTLFPSSRETMNELFSSAPSTGPSNLGVTVLAPDAGVAAPTGASLIRAKLAIAPMTTTTVMTRLVTRRQLAPAGRPILRIRLSIADPPPLCRDIGVSASIVTASKPPVHRCFTCWDRHPNCMNDTLGDD